MLDDVVDRAFHLAVTTSNSEGIGSLASTSSRPSISSPLAIFIISRAWCFAFARRCHRASLYRSPGHQAEGGFLGSYPANRWLLKTGLKEKM
ncbi:hypothetical protein [Bradyrhizobium sp. ORS 111]|uniref:hypothetical protein n=1 Tax=Bradyrhizobium sp. ORS 111 TaxID=1685958 RepID=UPI00388FB283